MTLEDIVADNMNGNHRKTVGKSLVSLLRRAQVEKRLTCAMIPAIKMLEMDPDRALFCIIPQSQQGDSALHIHSVLLQAFCYENNINIIKVDSADKLGDILSDGSNGPRMDCSCVLVQRPWATDQLQLTDQEKELTRFCNRTNEVFPSPVIQLPES